MDEHGNPWCFCGIYFPGKRMSKLSKKPYLWRFFLTNGYKTSIYIDVGNLGTSSNYINIRIQRRNFDMNKADLVTAMAEKAGVSKKDAEASLKAFTDIVAEELKKGEKIQLVGFGTFEVSERAARTGRNPQTGAEMTIPASKAPKFKAGKALKDSLN